MKNLFKYILQILIISTSGVSNAQVGINTTTPSSAAALHIAARRYPTTNNFGGFLMPVVTQAQQALIPVGPTDDGLMVFVSDNITGKHCWEIYDATVNVWRSVKCTVTKNCTGQVFYTENFDTYIDPSGITGANSAVGSYPASVTKWVLSSYSSARNGNPQSPGTLLDVDDYALATASELQIQDTNGPLLFQTQKIDIEGYADIMVSMEIENISSALEYFPANHIDDFECGGTTGLNGSDYVDIAYSTDGGFTFTEVPNYLGKGNSNHTYIGPSLVPNTLETFSLSGISGTSLVLRVRFQTWGGAEQIKIDQISIRCN